jgi:putative acetyltransferase
MNISIRNEIPDDIAVIRRVNEAAFDTKAEADLVDRLRDAGAISLSLVAVLKETIIGHILFSPPERPAWLNIINCLMNCSAL